MNPNPSRRSLFGTASAAALTLLGEMPALATATAISTAAKSKQIPGVYDWAVGDMKLIAISDGYAKLPLSTVPRATAQEASELAQAAFLPQGDILVAINTYLVQVGSKLVLVDTGAGGAFGPTAGKIGDNLKAANIDPKSVDVLVLTHAHPDHILGMTLENGDAAFPNAELFVHRQEKAYWMDDANASRAADFAKPWFQLARKAFKAYDRNTTLFDRNDQEILSGITVKELPGHTPGHTGLLLASRTDQLLIWGDIVHLPHLQFPHPDWGVAFDVDPDLALKTRRRMMDVTSTDRMTICGMHLSFPGFGHVARRREDYAFVPATWRYDL